MSMETFSRYNFITFILGGWHQLFTVKSILPGGPYLR